MNWNKKVRFRDLCYQYDLSADEFEEVERVKPLWIERFNSQLVLKHFVPDIKKIKTKSQFNRFLNKVYDYCDDMGIWVEL